MKKIIAILLVPALLCSVLCGCSFRRVFDAELLEDVEPVIAAPSLSPASQRIRTYPLTLCFNKDMGLHPYYTENLYNCAVDSLLYESLFSVDDTGSWTPLLCKSYSTKDGIHFYLGLDENVMMHDGNLMTADDVIYSLRLAATTDKYRTRLSCITDITTDESGTLCITISAANYNFPALLDVPILRSETGSYAVPPGTGPYTFIEGTNQTYCLKLFSSYRLADEVVQETIQLLDLDYAETKNALIEGAVDALIQDPTANGSYAFDYTYDFHYFSTPVLDYIGFNTQHTHVLNPKFRQAIQLLIDRNALVQETLSGQAMATSIIFSPVSQDYDDTLEQGKAYNPKQAEALLKELGYSDSDHDGMLEYSDAEKTEEKALEISLLLVVNSENQSKVAAARHVCNMLNAAGLPVQMQALPWAEYSNALTTGAYDLYFGEVRLTADNNFSCLLSQDGAANFSKFTSTEYDTAISSYLASRTEAGRRQTAASLCNTIFNQCTISPLCYRQYALITHRGAVSSLHPSLSNMYNGITSWKFNPSIAGDSEEME